MAQNLVEIHVPESANHSFAVAAGANVKIGDFVSLTSDGAVEPVATGKENSNKVIGMVYSGTVGVDGVNAGYDGNRGDVVTVIVNKPLVYATVTSNGPVAAGDYLVTTSAKRVATYDPPTGDPDNPGGTDTPDMIIGRAITSGGAGERIAIMLG